MADIFLSYAREDLPHVKPLIEALERKGWSVWWDTKIPAGKSFDEVIEEALSISKCVMVVWTHRSIASEWVRIEAGEGYRKILIPVRLEKIDPPLKFRHLQTADLIGWKGNSRDARLKRLFEDVSVYIGPPPAEEWVEKPKSGLRGRPEIKAKKDNSTGLKGRSTSKIITGKNGSRRDFQFKNLIFEGGGTKCIAYAGVLSELSQIGILSNIVRVGGTSGGTIVAVLVALKYNISEINDILFNLNFRDFVDSGSGKSVDEKRLVREFGLNRGDNLRNWISELIANKTGSPYTTFGELQAWGQYLDLYLIGTNITTGYWEVFSSEHTPTMRVADGARIAMSIPLLFKSVRYGENVFVEGGMLKNYPVKLFDRMRYLDNPSHCTVTVYYEKNNERMKPIKPKFDPFVYNKESLGFHLISQIEVGGFEEGAAPPLFRIENISDYIPALLNILIDLQDNRQLHNDDWNRTIFIDTLGVRATESDISTHMKEALVESGRQGVKKYFAWFNDPRITPINRL